MTAEDTSKKGSGTSTGAGEGNPTPSADDAILRNLASLMSQKSDKRSSFKSPKPALPEMDEDTASGIEIAETELHQEKTKDASSAAELRRSQRLQKSSQGPSAPEDTEMDVVFEEDSPACSTPMGNKGDISTDQTINKAGDKKFVRLGFTALELISLGLLLIALLYAALMFASPIRNAVASYRLAGDQMLSVPTQSIAGQFVQLEGVHSYWRNRNQNDRVQKGSSILPVISIETAKGNGTLQIIFRDEIGRIRGDAHVFRIESDTAIHALGTSGMDNEVQFSEYRLHSELNSNEYWTITIKESAGEENWVLVGKYRLPADRR